MKRLLIALIVATLALSGCGLFGTHNAWKQAKQENPLQIPPGLDRPATTAALTIPPPANMQAASVSSQPATLPANATSMHLPGAVSAAYKRVGLALQHGDIGTVTAQNEAQHTYELSITPEAALGSSSSFLKKHFSNLNQQHADTSTGNSNASAGKPAVVVTLSVTPAKGGGSTVSASGDPQQSAHVISVLNSRLGG